MGGVEGGRGVGRGRDVWWWECLLEPKIGGAGNWEGGWAGRQRRLGDIRGWES